MLWSWTFPPAESADSRWLCKDIYIYISINLCNRLTMPTSQLRKPCVMSNLNQARWVEGIEHFSSSSIIASDGSASQSLQEICMRLDFCVRKPSTLYDSSDNAHGRVKLTFVCSHPLGLHSACLWGNLFEINGRGFNRRTGRPPVPLRDACSIRSFGSTTRPFN